MALNVGELFADLTLKTDRFNQSLNAATQTLTASMNRIRSTLSSGGQAGGRMFSSGLAAGISSGRSKVVSAAARVAAAAVAAANKKLRIASPSRVMMQSGAYFAEGFARGIDSCARMAETAAARMAGSAASSTKTAPAQSNFDYDRLAALVSLPELSLTLDGQRLAEITAADAGRAQSIRRQRLALGYGKR